MNSRAIGLNNNLDVIILAPHLDYPPDRGANIYIAGVARHLIVKRDKIAILGAHTLVTYKNGHEVSQEKFNNSFRPKIISAIRTLLFNSHYLAEKFLTIKYIKQANKLLALHPEALVLCSYIFTASMPIFSKTAKPLVVFSHNDELIWYDNLRRSSKNPFFKWVAYISKKWIIKFLHEHSKDFVFAHIAESDLKGYKKLLPDHLAMIVPVGVNIVPIPKFQIWDGKIHLLFCGSLSTQMNYDALIYFKEYFWDILRVRLQEKMDVWVAGKNPIWAVKKLCSEERWKLFPNLSNEELNNLHQKATFGILPFPYTTGAKIKLLNSLALGLPIMATTNMNCLVDQDFYPNLYSDNPKEWTKHAIKFTGNGVSIEDRINCQKFVSKYSWSSIADRFDSDLKKMGL